MLPSGGLDVAIISESLKVVSWCGGVLVKEKFGGAQAKWDVK
jgi:hypothetical protein